MGGVEGYFSLSIGLLTAEVSCCAALRRCFGPLRRPRLGAVHRKCADQDATLAVLPALVMPHISHARRLHGAGFLL